MVLICLQGELGVNAILAVSIAACRAGAAEKEAWLFVNSIFSPLLSLVCCLANKFIYPYKVIKKNKTQTSGSALQAHC